MAGLLAIGACTVGSDGHKYLSDAGGSGDAGASGKATVGTAGALSGGGTAGARAGVGGAMFAGSAGSAARAGGASSSSADAGAGSPGEGGSGGEPETGGIGGAGGSAASGGSSGGTPSIGGVAGSGGSPPVGAGGATGGKAGGGAGGTTGGAGGIAGKGGTGTGGVACSAPSRSCGSAAELGQCKQGSQTCTNGAWGACQLINIPDSQSKACDDGNFVTSGEKCLDGACSGLEDPVLADKTIASGGTHTCAIRLGGKVYCWGQNLANQLGVATTGSYSAVPLEVPGITNAVAVTAGAMHSCALRATGELLCWGATTFGALGRGPAADGRVGPVTGLVPTRISARGGFTTCALTAAGSVWCWGDNSHAQLGIAATTVSSDVPIQATSIVSATRISAGGDFSCVIHGAQNAVACWGRNDLSQLGNTAGPDTPSPPAYRSPITGATHVAAGSDFACARLSTGQVICWGDNSQNQKATAGSLTVANLSTATNVVAGGQHACALLTSGQINCWGYNSIGQLGNDSTVNGATSQLVAGGFSDFSAVAAGNHHTCARRTNGQVMCWGQNHEGELGNGTTLPSSVPIAVSGLP